MRKSQLKAEHDRMVQDELLPALNEIEKLKREIKSLATLRIHEQLEMDRVKRALRRHYNEIVKLGKEYYESE